MIRRVRYRRVCRMNGFHVREAFPLPSGRWSWLCPLVKWINGRSRLPWHCERCIRRANLTRG